MKISKFWRVSQDHIFFRIRWQHLKSSLNHPWSPWARNTLLLQWIIVLGFMKLLKKLVSEANFSRDQLFFHLHWEKCLSFSRIFQTIVRTIKMNSGYELYCCFASFCFLRQFTYSLSRFAGAKMVCETEYMSTVSAMHLNFEYVAVKLDGRAQLRKVPFPKQCGCSGASLS